MTDFYPYLVFGVWSAAALGATYYLGLRRGRKLAMPVRDWRGRFVKKGLQ